MQNPVQNNQNNQNKGAKNMDFFPVIVQSSSPCSQFHRQSGKSHGEEEQKHYYIIDFVQIHAS
jgi:hypothetical protein